MPVQLPSPFATPNSLSAVDQVSKLQAEGGWDTPQGGRLGLHGRGGGWGGPLGRSLDYYIGGGMLVGYANTRQRGWAHRVGMQVAKKKRNVNHT